MTSDDLTAGVPQTRPWTELLADALVGTDRRPGAEPAQVLDAAGAWAAYRRAGVAPLAGPGSLPAPAPAETRPLVGDRADARLALLLDGGGRLDGGARDAILTEWLELARDRGRRVPPERLAALLAAGRTRTALRPLIAAVGGHRARWLAEQNPEWTYLVATGSSEDPHAWETGNPAQRRGYLAALRRRDPAAARELLTREWSTIAPAERADLLATLRDGLDPADEALLESALGDKRAPVRALAADLLAILPGSDYQARATARARQHLVVTDAGVELRLPEACDPGMRRDGIAVKPPAGTGERAWWLEELLARAPLSTWPAATNLLPRLADLEFTDAVHDGLARAAATHRDPTWAAAMIDVLRPALDDPGRHVRIHQHLTALYPLLPRDQLVAQATAAVTATGLVENGLLADQCPRPWPPELAAAVLSGLVSLARDPAQRSALTFYARLAALRLPTTTDLSAIENIDADLLMTLVETLSFRHELTQEIEQ